MAGKPHSAVEFLESVSEDGSTQELDEAFVFQGGENSLKMEQIYTKTFQCMFAIEKI